MTKNGFKDTRLLEALDYIDRDLIGEVAVKLKIEESAVLTEEPVMTWRTPFKHWKRMLATVACLLLLSAAFPVLDYAVQRFGTGIWDGNAGAGTEELETPTQAETQALETENEITEAVVIDFDKALERYADMSAKEIYADVLKGGWVVDCLKDNLNNFVTGGDIWNEFYEQSNSSIVCSVLLAYYFNNPPHGEEYVFLTKIVFDGEKYCYSRFDSRSDSITDSGEYKYLKKDFVEIRLPPEMNKISGLMTTYTLTNYSDWEYDCWLSLLLGSQDVTNRSELLDCVVIINHTDSYDDSIFTPTND